MPQVQSNLSHIAVVIPFHHRHDLLLPLLSSVLSMPVLVVDDGAHATFFPPGVRSIRSKGKGFAAAANTGLEYWEKRGVSTVLLLNDDVDVTEEAISILAKHHHEKRILSPVIHCDGQTTYGVSVSEWGRIRTHFAPDKKKIDAVYGTCMMLSSSLRFDEGYSHGFEDIELCLRMNKQGYQSMVILEANCDHIGGASLSSCHIQGQRSATYGQLRLFSSIRRAPVISMLSGLQIIKESGGQQRYLGFFLGVFDWIYKDLPSLAARIASSKAGSNNAR